MGRVWLKICQIFKQYKVISRQCVINWYIEEAININKVTVILFPDSKISDKKVINVLSSIYITLEICREQLLLVNTTLSTKSVENRLNGAIHKHEYMSHNIAVEHNIFQSLRMITFDDLQPRILHTELL